MTWRQITLLWMALVPAVVHAQVQGLATRSAVLDDLQRRALATLAAIPRARTMADATRDRPMLRERLGIALGIGRMPQRDHIEAKLVGNVRLEGITIEKIVFETVPGEWIPAHVYVPDALGGPAPAVLLVLGRAWKEGKSHRDAQAFCRGLARLGFVVLTFDPPGQGERYNTTEAHNHPEALLVGISEQGLVQNEIRAAIAYLSSRQDVDGQRIGMTGTAGAGLATWIAAALDDKLAASIPVDGTDDWSARIPAMRLVDGYGEGDRSELVPGLIQFANYHELLAMAAPKPVLMIASGKQ